MCIFIYSNILAQDNIILKTGEEVKSKVLEITTTEIKYKKFDNQDGPAYTILKSDVFLIKYENGSKDIFNESTTKESLTNELSSNEKSIKRPFNGSIYFIGGNGFKSSSVDISGGGGVGFDASLGYNFSKSFGITADIGWQQSFGNDPSGNIDIDFTRWQLLLTPKLLLPINNKNQFNLGGGLGLYFDGYNFLYASYDDNLSIFYSPALGIHALCEYKYHINNRLSIGLGVKYTAVTYKANYVSDDIPVSSLKNEYRNFEGNGLDFYAGLSINF